MVNYACPNPTCRKMGCYEHCNSCGESVIWRPPLLDREIAYKGPKPLNQDASVHRCMLNGTNGRGYFKTMTAPQLRRYHEIPGYTPAQVESMKDPIIKAEWKAGVRAWLEKWEPKQLEVVVVQ